MVMSGGIAMTDLLLLSEAQMRRIEPYFPLSHGIARVDDRRVISGIIFVIRNGLRWRDAARPRTEPHLEQLLHRRRAVTKRWAEGKDGSQRQ